MEANQITDQKNRGIKINKFRIFRYTLISVCAATYFRVFCYIFPGVLVHISGCSATYFRVCCYIFPGVLLHISGRAATYFRVCCYIFPGVLLHISGCAATYSLWCFSGFGISRNKQQLYPPVTYRNTASVTTSLVSFLGPWG